MPGLFQGSCCVVNPACSDDRNFEWGIHCFHGLGTVNLVINVPIALGLVKDLRIVGKTVKLLKNVTTNRTLWETSLHVKA